VNVGNVGSKLTVITPDELTFTWFDLK